MTFKKSNKQFSGRELIAHAVAVYKVQKGKYIKSHEVNKDKGIESNFKLMLGLLHEPSKSNIKIVNDDYDMADEIIEYFEGLIFKAMTRNLTDFENKITALIKADDMGRAQDILTAYTTWTGRHSNCSGDRAFLQRFLELCQGGHSLRRRLAQVLIQPYRERARKTTDQKV